MQILSDNQAELVTGGVKPLSIGSLTANNVLVVAPQVNIALILGRGTVIQGNGIGIGIR